MKPLILLACSTLLMMAAGPQTNKCASKAAAAAEAFAQPSHREQLRRQPAAIRNHRVAQEGDSLVVAFDVEIPARYIAQGEAYVLTPVLTTPEGDTKLPVLSIEGRYYYLLGDRCDSARQVRYTGKSQTVCYREAIACASGLRNAGLRIEATRRWVCACRDASAAVGSTQLAANKPADLSAFAGKTQILYYIPAPYTQSGSYVGDFGGRSVFRNNGTTVDREVFDPFMQEVIAGYERLKEDTTVRIRSIEVKVSSSPDGKYAYNDFLARTRAQNIRTHLEKGFANADLSLVEVTPEAENWEAFTAALPASEITDKAAVERILADVDDPDEREAQLRQLREWPAVYRIFNASRNCRIVIGYDIVRRHPAACPLTDAGLVETRLDAPAGYIDTAEAERIAALDSTAAHLNNLMVAYTEQGAYEKALACAARIADSETCPAIANNKAVLYVLTEQPDRAEALFARAAEPARSYNLGVMALNAGDEATAEELLAPYTEKQY